jgi:hypothetical protein
METGEGGGRGAASDKVIMLWLRGVGGVEGPIHVRASARIWVTFTRVAEAKQAHLLRLTYETTFA